MIHNDQLRESINSSFLKLKQKRLIAFVISEISMCALIGLLGAYSLIKDSLARSAEIEEDILGLGDGLSFLGTMIGFIYLGLKPTRTPKKRYLLFSLGLSLSFSLIPMVSWFPPYHSIVFFIGSFLSGYFRACLQIPMFIINQYFNKENDKFYIRVWFSLNSIGNILAMSLISILMGLSFSW